MRSRTAKPRGSRFCSTIPKQILPGAMAAARSRDPLGPLGQCLPPLPSLMELAPPKRVYDGVRSGLAQGNERPRVEVDARPVFRGRRDTLSSLRSETRPDRAYGRP